MALTHLTSVRRGIRPEIQILDEIERALPKIKGESVYTVALPKTANAAKKRAACIRNSLAHRGFALKKMGYSTRRGLAADGTPVLVISRTK